MRESLIYTQRHGSILYTDCRDINQKVILLTFCLKISRDLACFVSSETEFQSFGPSHLKLSFPKETVLIFGTL